MFIVIPKSRAEVGYDQPFDFACPHCDTRARGYVSTVGSGEALTSEGARQNALANAASNAAKAIRAAACPECRLPQAALVEEVENARAYGNKLRRLGLKIGRGLGAAIAVVGAFWAVPDLVHSNKLALAVAGAAATAFFGALAIAGETLVSRPVVTTPFGVFFWREGHGRDHRTAEPVGWKPAEPTGVHAPTAPSTFRRVAFSLGAFTGVALAMFGFTRWKATFIDVYVVSARGDAKILLDGKEVSPAPRDPSKDVPYDKVTVRADKRYSIDVTTKDGTDTFEVEGPAKSPGWLLMPHAEENDLCITEETHYYGTSGAMPKATLLETNTGLVELTVAPQFEFEDPPKSVSSKHATTRFALRAYRCASLAPRESPRLFRRGGEK